MDLLFVLIILPALLLIGFFIAVIVGFRSKNRKRYFITLGCITAVVAFLISMLFIDYEGIIANAFHRTKVPAEYNHYHHLTDTVTADYTIKEFQGSELSDIFTDSLSSHLIVITHSNSLDFEEFYFRIDTAGNYTTFKRPKELFQERRYLIGAKNWCDWIFTGDTTLKVYTPIKDILNRKTLQSWYKEADYVQFLDDSICILHKGKTWYSCRINFRPEIYSDSEEYKDKDDYASAHWASRQIDITSSKDEEAKWVGIFLDFDKFPMEVSEGALCFDYFSKEEYHSGFSHFLSGIGNPTGGGNDNTYWEGSGYFRLRFGCQQFPVVYHMTQDVKHDKTYQMKLSIYTTPTYAILSGYEGVYWVKVK